MFAPKRSPEDRAIIAEVKKWARSEQMKLDLEPFLQAWASKERPDSKWIAVRELAISTGYAELNRDRGTVVADGTIWVDIETGPLGVETFRCPAIMSFDIHDGAAVTTTLSSVYIEPIASSVRLTVDAEI